MLKLLLKHKNLIIIFLVIVSFLIFVKERGFKRITENFENANLIDVINGLDVQDQKLNDIIKSSSATNVTFNKNIVTNKNIKSSGHITAGKDITLNSNGNIIGKQLTVTGKIKGDTLNIGGANLDKTDIRKLKALKNLAGYALNGDGSTHLLFEGHHKLYGNNKFDTWANDKWDVLYLFKGWRIRVWKDANKQNIMKDVQNKKEDVKKVGIENNKASEYEITWIDY